MRGDAAARAAGIALLLAGRCDLAIAEFERVRSRDATDWNDLAAANVCAAHREHDPQRWLAALAATDVALRLAPGLAEARFNRAATLEGLQLTPLARVSWNRYLAMDGASVWADVARRRLSALAPSDIDAWKAATSDLFHLSSQILETLTSRHPQAARRFADAAYLSEWAAAVRSGCRAEADRNMRIVRVIARTLRQRGEPMLADIVAAVDAADESRLEAIVAGHLAYHAGRLALREGNAAAAEYHFRAATKLFRAGRSPMVLTAEFWIACALAIQERSDDALRILDSLTDRTSGYPAIAAHVQYQYGLLDAVRGNWSSSLAAARRSVSAFERLGERGNLANAHALLAEDHDLLGQAERALLHGLIALRASAADGALDRTRVVLAVLCRIELRAQRWHTAYALARLEAELAPLARDVRLDPDMFIRTAVAEARGGAHARGLYWIRLARHAASRASDSAVRDKLIADVDAAEGSLERERNPRSARELLSRAIAYQSAAVRPIVLPQLYLERGRASIALHDMRAAEADFDAGIAELERQRVRVSDAELRPGIFDNAFALFDAAINLRVDQGRNDEEVWWYVQRGRSRALLEQISGTGAAVQTPALPRVRDVQRVLPRSSAVLEYVSLPERLLIFIITRDRFAMRISPVSRASLNRIAEDFLRSRGRNGAQLHDVLLAPLQRDLDDVLAVNVIGDDMLQRVPVAALFNRATRTYAVEHYIFAMSPSASVLVKTLARAATTGASKPPAVVAFGDPTVPRDEFGDLPALPAAATEAERIARVYQTGNAFVREAATAERFCDVAPAFEVVHFGGHGVVREREPSASALVCAATRHRRGALEASDIARLPLRKTRVVVLAACSTMTGRNAAIEGVPSLARAFLIAGVSAVVGTLWDVQDREATAITLPLHERLSRSVPASHALRAAQLEAIRRRIPVSQWSAFALTGSATP